MNTPNNPSWFLSPDGIPIPVDPSTIDDQSQLVSPVPIPFPLTDPSTIDNQPGNNQAGSDLIVGIPIPVLSDPLSPGVSPGYPAWAPPAVPFELVVTVENVCKEAFDGTMQLRDVSFKLFKGKVACILGGVDDGAYPLLQVLALEELASRGSLSILNKEVSQLTIEERSEWHYSHIAYIRLSHLELVEQTPHMLVAYWLHYFDDIKWSEAKEAARLALRSVGLAQYKGDGRFRDLSPMEQARVNIAKACAHSRRNRCMYLFEDCFLGVDHDEAVELIRLLTLVAARRGKVVVVQTNRQDITSHFDQVLEMRNGELVTVRNNP